MNALLIALHGSRIATANQAIQAIAMEIAETCEGRWDSIGLGFLQFGAPPLRGALEQLAGEGARRITLVPLFLGAGRHVEEDIPRTVSAFANEHPEVQVLVAPHFGAWEGMAATIIAMGAEAEEAG